MEGPSFPGGMPDDPLYDSSYQHSHVTPKYLGVESRKPISPHNAYQMNGYQAPTYSHAPPPPPQARFRVDGSNLDYSKQSTEHFSESSGAYASTDHNPYEKPDVFDNIASQLLNLHSKNERKYPLQRKSIDELLNQVFTTADEQRAFAKAYRCRLFDLPTFPESGEASTSALIRKVEKLYGEALKNRKDQYHPATHPASPPTTVTSRDTNKSVFPSEPVSSSYPSSTVYGSPQVPHPHGRPQQSRYIEDSSLSVNADQSSWNFGKPVQSQYENKHDESLPQPSNPYGNIQPPPQNHNTPSLSQSKLDHTINTGIKRGLNMNTYGPRSPHDDANMVKQANKQQRDTDVYQEESTDERDDGNGMVYTLDPEQMTTNLRSPSKTSTQEMGECFTYQSEASVTASTFTQDTGDRKIKLQQKQAILHNCDPAEDFQSKMKQHLLDEMEHASLVLQTTTNKEARAQHLRHMKNLRLQWENLKKLSPQQAKVGVNAEMSNMQPKKNEDTLPEKNTQAELVVMPRISYKSVTPHTRESIQQSGCEKSVYSNLADDKSTVSFPSNRPMGKQVADVVAPESLPAHFIFEARLGNQVFLATVVRACFCLVLPFERLMSFTNNLKIAMAFDINKISSHSFNMFSNLTLVVMSTARRGCYKRTGVFISYA